MMISSVNGVGPSDPSNHVLRLFAAQERPILARLASCCAENRGLQLVGPEGEVHWTSIRKDAPVVGFAEAPLGALPGRLRLLRFEHEGIDDEDLWLRLAALLLDSAAEHSREMAGLMDEHITLSDQLLALYNIARGTHAQLELDDQLQVVLKETVRVAGMDAGIVWTAGPEGNRVLVQPQGPALAGVGAALAGCEDSIEAETILAEPAVQGSYFGCVTAPLLVAQERRGQIVLLSADPQRTMLSRDTMLATAMADLAGVFIETAALQRMAVHGVQMAKELEIARSIQNLLIPATLASTAEHDVVAFYRPARHVGGDFYLAQPMSGGRMLLALGDVAGKGVPAALLMSMTRTAVLSLAEQGTRPGQILRRIGRILFDDLDRTGKFVTLLVALHDPRAQRLVLANAGHSPVYLAPRGGAYRRLSPTAPPLGVVNDHAVKDDFFDFGEGDLLVITSDGFSEARNVSGGIMGLTELEAILAACPRSSAQGVLDGIVQGVTAFTGSAAQADDQTGLVLRGSAAA